MTLAELENALLEIAREYIKQGPGVAQETVVLREAMQRHFGGSERLEHEQLVLTAWHELFRTGKLSWGYDISNPGSPFFHVAEHAERAQH
ncbi:MAG: hypothetical protein HQ581_03320 [Planctomycetes bacterium]|nr:hypothetical protein [Planctomycetota bacterium]